MIQYRTSSFNFDNSENVAYDHPAFPSYIRKASFSASSDYPSIQHWHEDLEFFVTISGTATYIIDGKAIHLHAGEGIFVNSRHMHNVFPPRAGECAFICILLHPSLLSANAEFTETYVDPFIHSMQYVYLVFSQNVPWQKQMINLLINLADQQQDSMIEAIVQSTFFSLFSLLFEHTQPEVLTADENHNSEKLNTLKTMILFIQEHYEESLTLQDIAGSIPCSTSKCIKLFKYYIKEPPITYLIKYRLNRSCLLLQTTDASITEIALDCGFHGASYYCRIFRKFYGMTPLAYKERLSKN